MAATSYAHLSDGNVRIYIGLYTGFLTYAIREFVHRFVSRQRQQLKLLDDFAAFLLEMPRVHNTMACNIILSSSLDYISSLLI